MAHEVSNMTKTRLASFVYRGINIVKFSESKYLVADTEVDEPSVHGYVLGFTSTLGEAQDLINHYL